MKPEIYLTVKDLSEWRSWLADNHSTDQVVWLVFYRQQTGLTTVDYECAIEEALCYGWIDSLIKRLDDHRYVRKFTRRTNTGKWSPANVARVKRLIATDRMTPAGMAVIDPAILVGASEPIRRANQELVFPPEFQEFLKENPGAWRYFNSLLTSQKRLTIG